MKNYFRKLTNVNWRLSRSCQRFLFPFTQFFFLFSNCLVYLIIFWEVPPGSSIYSPSSCLYDGPLLPNHPSWDDVVVLPCPSICPGEIDLMCSIVLASSVIFVFLSALQERVPNIETPYIQASKAKSKLVYKMKVYRQFHMLFFSSSMVCLLIIKIKGEISSWYIVLFPMLCLSSTKLRQ